MLIILLFKNFVEIGLILHNLLKGSSVEGGCHFALLLLEGSSKGHSIGCLF